MKLEYVDIFYNDKIYSTDVIEQDSYEKIKNDIEQVWGLEKGKVELVCYDYQEYRDFISLNSNIKVFKGYKISELPNKQVITIKSLYIK